ncbi:MAG: asparagine synthase (glutamine-hydrolyzing) [Archangium sp.]|nr:asparagine synthase (glutamine-hydrolyzing) [Archangium sp.]MDP3575845.1 asparagine synthase (glutamine-hydrolyzing) [Archangium sp.]
MCGIAGVVYRDGRRAEERVLRAMAQTIAHRGPDGEGVQSFEGAGLAHRRLAIIDLSPAGAQPMQSSDGSAWIAFNGEIYNFPELRKELEGLGHQFRSHTDTEVILAGWLQWGEGVVGRLDGMFALALWDLKQRRLFLARDRTGKKPLYVYEDQEKVVFASEIKAILAHPAIDRAHTPDAIPQFLSHGYVPTPGTFYSRIRKLKPAHFEIISLGEEGTKATQYWEFPLGASREVTDLREVEGRIRELFFAAVKRRMLSDVPLGAFLSGGIDSTLVVAAMARFSSKPVKTFSIGFEGYPDWDETKYARQVADRYGTEHTEFKVKPESFELIDKLAWHYDEPFGDSSAIPTYLVSKLTRAKVTVALTGDGGDELFAGYPRFAAAVAAERVPSLVRRIARRALAPLPAGRRHGSTWERARRFALHASQPLPERLRNWVSLFPASELQTLLIPELAAFATPAHLGSSYTELDRATGRLDPMNRVLYLNSKTYLLDDLNVKMDRASMAASLEGRAPFLDTALMDYVSTLPGSLKARGTNLKWILKRAFGDLLPHEVIHRKKMGFGVPLGAWFREGVKAQLEDRLLNPGSPLRAFFRKGALEGLFAQHQENRRDLGLQFWGLWLLDSWLTREKEGRSGPC